MSNTFATYLARRLEKDREHLEEFFPNIEDIKGTIIRMQVEKGCENYRKNIKDPMEEDTLILRDNHDGILLFFNHSERATIRCIFEGVTIMSRFSYTEGCVIHKKCKPADVPYHLQKYVFGDTHGLEDSLEKLQIHDNLAQKFLSENFQKGGMVSLKEMKRHPKWRKEYEGMIEVKLVNICKSCGLKAHSGCCSGYSTSNRKKIKMVLGWSA